MKYKLILYNSYGSSDVDLAGTFTFYTFNAAHECATQWIAQASFFQARLWDGETWRVYTG